MAEVPVGLEQWGSRSLTISGFTATKVGSTSIYYGCRASLKRMSGKYMYEYRLHVNQTNDSTPPGIVNYSATYTDSANNFGWLASEYTFIRNGQALGAGALRAYGVSYVIGDVIGVLVDMDNKTISFAKNGVNLGVAFTAVTGITEWVPGWRSKYQDASATFNFGATPLSYPIAGYYPWNYNVPQSLQGVFMESPKLSHSFDRLGLHGYHSFNPILGEKPTIDYVGHHCQIIDSGSKEGISSGIYTPLICPGRRDKILSGKYLEELSSVIKQPANTQGHIISDLIPASRISVKLNGVEIIPVLSSSNAQSRFNLVVTPTHQYKNQVVNISSTNSQSTPLMGLYELRVGDTVIVPFGSITTDLREVSIDLPPSQLLLGNNLCRITYNYATGKLEYLDFEIFKEEPKRTQVERLFRYYDGGYEGERLSSAYAAAPAIYPCFLIPDGQTSTLIRTTDYTSIPLVKYTDIQGVYIDGSGLRMLVSFDKGLTWSAFDGSAWHTVALENIAEKGMSETVVNAITLAQWAGLFKPTAIDFAIYLSSGLSSYIPSRINNFYSETSIPGASGASRNVYPSFPARPASNLLVSRIGLRKVSQWSTGNPYVAVFITSNLSSNEKLVLIRELQWSEIYYDALPGEIITQIRGYSYTSTGVVTLYSSQTLAYLKSINVQITPRLRTGYAFIM